MRIFLFDFRNRSWGWMNLKKTADQKWFSGEFNIDDIKIESNIMTEINVNAYIDMTPSGLTLQRTQDFATNATDMEKAGI